MFGTFLSSVLGSEAIPELVMVNLVGADGFRSELRRKPVEKIVLPQVFRLHAVVEVWKLRRKAKFGNSVFMNTNTLCS